MNPKYKAIKALYQSIHGATSLPDPIKMQEVILLYEASKAKKPVENKKTKKHERRIRPWATGTDQTD
tara:strand:- start:5836 stop:6036 length:201 start_codon:yes stop_codon:yes gene_type:complete